jgi:2,5-dioxopentanoate dehydrogenase
MELTGKNILGHTFSASGNQFLRAVNPQDGTSPGYSFPIATDQEIESAMALAAKAAQELSNFSAERKARFLLKIADNIMQTDDFLIQTAHFETGLPEGRIISERGRTINQIRMFADFISEGSWVEATIDTGLPAREPLPKPDLRKMLFPIGSVVVFGSSNFPLAFSVAGGDTISALAAGNPVIVKAHPAHPGTSDIVGQCIRNAAIETGMPEGTFSLLYDSGFQVGQTLVSHPSTKAVSFTGSFSGGKALFDLAMKRPDPIPVFAEMGSVNPIFILPEVMQASGNETAEKIAGSVTLGAGQFCTNPGLVLLVNNSDAQIFMDSLSERIRSAIPQTMLTPSIAQRYDSDCHKVIGGNQVQLLSKSTNPAGLNQAVPVIASVSGDIFEKNTSLSEEIFGPFSLVVLCDSIEQMMRIAQELPGQLTASIFYKHSTELSNHAGLIEILQSRAGRIVFNGVPTGVEVCHSMHHGGPFPASTDSRFTSVGTAAIKRWARPVAFQDCPDELLPLELQSGNPLNIWRLVNGKTTSQKL